ncbi:MAG: GntR family transcriptional regulator [Capsulimonadaceae bacterium]
MSIRLQIAVGSSTPIYWQIVDQICKEIAAGRLVPGDQMPSVRALAEQVVVNPNTVARAYSDLVRDGVLETQRGKGVYVADRRSVFSAEERERRLDAALDVFLHEAMLLGLGGAEIGARLEVKLLELGQGPSPQVSPEEVSQ